MRLILFLNVLNAAKAADFVTEDQKAVSQPEVEPEVERDKNGNGSEIEVYILGRKSLRSRRSSE